MVLARFDRFDHFICFCKILHILVLSLNNKHMLDECQIGFK